PDDGTRFSLPRPAQRYQGPFTPPARRYWRRTAPHPHAKRPPPTQLPPRTAAVGPATSTRRGSFFVARALGALRRHHGVEHIPPYAVAPREFRGVQEREVLLQWDVEVVRRRVLLQAAQLFRGAVPRAAAELEPGGPVGGVDLLGGA